mmetsp:Transcript_76327/g.233561  ORF Transcript_76327/g.233561 Transcript_76327/m.233561 type:complete len:242 (+) Transcript_76327:222-947(+)
MRRRNASRFDFKASSKSCIRLRQNATSLSSMLFLSVSLESSNLCWAAILLVPSGESMASCTAFLSSADKKFSSNRLFNFMLRFCCLTSRKSFNFKRFWFVTMYNFLRSISCFLQKSNFFFATDSESSGQISNQGSSANRFSRAARSWASLSAFSTARFAASTALFASVVLILCITPSPTFLLSTEGMNSMNDSGSVPGGTMTGTTSPDAKATCNVDPRTAPFGTSTTIGTPPPGKDGPAGG